MSRYMNPLYKDLIPYTPGEQPQNRQYIKLNTNESPFPPAPGVLDVVNREAASMLRLYSDPTVRPLKEALADRYDVRPENIFVGNGSDDCLNFAFMAFGGDGAAFADITYGFYSVFANLHHVRADIRKLKEDYSLDPADYRAVGKAIFIANPNAPTGLTIPVSKIEEIVRSNAGHVVVIDEAYVDFGAESAVPFVKKYPNLLVVQTFSKSRSLAGARVGYAIGSEQVIQDLETIRYSTNPYNINRISMAAAIAAVKDRAYYQANCRKIMGVREYTKAELSKLGFRVLNSQANFVFAEHPDYSGKTLYEQLKERGILVRHLPGPRTDNFNRITIGTKEQMDAMLAAMKEILNS